MKYRYSCIKGLKKISCQREKEISFEQFRKKIGEDNYKKLEKNLGYRENYFELEDDWHVKYHKATLPNKKNMYYVEEKNIRHIYY